MNWHWINWIVIFICFLGIIGIEIYFYKKMRVLQIILEEQEKFRLW